MSGNRQVTGLVGPIAAGPGGPAELLRRQRLAARRTRRGVAARWSYRAAVKLGLDRPPARQAVRELSPHFPDLRGVGTDPDPPGLSAFSPLSSRVQEHLGDAAVRSADGFGAGRGSARCRDQVARCASECFAARAAIRVVLKVSGATDPIAAVLARMHAIGDQLTAADGVARFNHLYLEETVAVDTATRMPGFEDPEFIAALDVVFAGLYFAAVDDAGGGNPPPRCWAPLFAARVDARIAPIQFALAGMNAHINHDLPLALVSTCEARSLELSRDSAQHRDYLRINQTIAATEARVKQEFLTGMVRVADEVLGRVDDVIAIWSIDEARNAAWTNAEALWALRDHPDLTAAFEDTLDGTVGFASRGLLVPTLPEA